MERTETATPNRLPSGHRLSFGLLPGETVEEKAEAAADLLAWAAEIALGVGHGRLESTPERMSAAIAYAIALRNLIVAFHGRGCECDVFVQADCWATELLSRDGERSSDACDLF